MPIERTSPYRTSERRNSRRSLMARQVTARCEDGDAFPISFVNISRNGFLAAVEQPVRSGALISVEGVRNCLARVVRVTDGLIACEFAKPAHPLDLLSLRGVKSQIAKAK